MSKERLEYLKNQAFTIIKVFKDEKYSLMEVEYIVSLSKAYCLGRRVEVKK